MTLLYIVLLLLANAFFVAAEFALVKVPVIRIEGMLAETNSFLARLTLDIQRNLEAYLAACQLGITMASLGLGWIGEPAVAAILHPLFEQWEFSEQALHTVSFLTGFIIFSSLHIVIGEQVPKSYAIREADRVSLWVAIPLISFYWFAFPLNWLLNAASSMCLRMIGVKEVSHVEVMTGSEIQGLIDVSRDHGEITEDKAMMLQNLFQFDERNVSSVIIPLNQIQFISHTDTTEEILEKIRISGHSRFPVIGEGWHDLKGVILAKQVLMAQMSGEFSATTLQDLMRKPQLIPETQPIKLLFDQMRSRREHMAFAIDEYGQVSGLVTLEDLLEEIVGDISDELDDTTAPLITTADDGTWTCSGLTPLIDLRREIGFVSELDTESVTLGGLVMRHLQRMPAEGDAFTDNGLEFEVTDIQDSMIRSVRIRRAD